MLLTGVVCGEEYSNLLLGGIRQNAPCVDCSRATNLDYYAIAHKLNANYFPMFNQGELFDQVGEVQNAATGEATDQNGLTNAALHGTENNPKEYDTILAYSGGTATAVTVLSNYDEYRVKCDTLILVSPMSAGVSDEIFAKIRKTYEKDCGGTACLKLLWNTLDIMTAKDQIGVSYRTQVRAILESDPPVVRNIIVITSPQDELMPYVSDIFQVRNFEAYTTDGSGDINPDITITTQEVPLTQFEDDGREAHTQLFFEYAITHLSNTDGGVVEFNPEGNPTVVEEERPTASAGSSTDSNPPTVQAFQVIPLSLTTDESFTIYYTVSDNDGSGLKQVELWRKDEQSDWHEIRPPNVLAGENGPISGSFADSTPAPGKYWYGLHAVDNAGNWNDEKNSNTNNQPDVYGPIEIEVTPTGTSPSLMESCITSDAKSWFEKGENFYNQSQYEEAIKCYDEAIKICQQYEDAWSGKGDAYLVGKFGFFMQNDAAKAIQCYDEALKINPQKAETWNNNGTALRALGKNDDAIQCYDEAIGINPQYAEAWFGKGYTLYEKGNYDEALKCVNEAITLKPEYPNFWKYKGEILKALGSDEAQSAFDKANELENILKPTHGAQGTVSYD